LCRLRRSALPLASYPRYGAAGLAARTSPASRLSRGWARSPAAPPAAVRTVPIGNLRQPPTFRQPQPETTEPDRSGSVPPDSDQPGRTAGHRRAAPRNCPSSTLTSWPIWHDVLGWQPIRAIVRLGAGRLQMAGGGIWRRPPPRRCPGAWPSAGSVRRRCLRRGRGVPSACRGPLECLLLLQFRLHILGMVLVGPRR
jgi:hypothetical protein